MGGPVKQRGNILFLILLAVVLFAALTYAVTSADRGRGKSASSESSEALAGTILQFFSLIDTAVLRMVTIGGVDPMSLDFGAGVTSGVVSNGTNPACTSVACQVFMPAGGGVKMLPLPLQATDPNSIGQKTSLGEGTAEFSIGMWNVVDVGTSLPDIIVAYRALKLDICNAINVAEGVYAKGGAPMYDAQEDWVLGNEDTRIRGKRTFCIVRSTANGYYLWHVIWPR